LARAQREHYKIAACSACGGPEIFSKTKPRQPSAFAAGGSAPWTPSHHHRPARRSRALRESSK
jgi:hypothetical protein